MIRAFVDGGKISLHTKENRNKKHQRNIQKKAKYRIPKEIRPRTSRVRSQKGGAEEENLGQKPHANHRIQKVSAKKRYLLDCTESAMKPRLGGKVSFGPLNYTTPRKRPNRGNTVNSVQDGMTLARGATGGRGGRLGLKRSSPPKVGLPHV